MRQFMVVGAMLLPFLSGGAIAQSVCTGSPLTDAQLVTLLAGNTVCANNGTDEWQEQHRGSAGATSGELWDYKKGPAPEVVDPTSQVGSWSISANQVHYNYGGPAYSFEVYESVVVGGSYCFSGPEMIEPVEIQTGETSCP